ncbi:MAG: DUF748 domain-containing protein [Victivallales bacterium]|jgi:hypothetical protein
MKGWKKIVVFSLLGIFGFVILLYFVLTSQTFIQSQILPRVSQAIGAPLTAKKISFSPFSGIELQNIEIGSGESQLLHAKTVRCGYELMPIFRGELIVRELVLDGVKIQVIQDAAGKSNLPHAPAKSVAPSVSPTTKKGDARAGLPFKPTLKNIRISNLSLAFRQTGKDSQQSLLFELRDFNLNLPEFRLDKPAKLEFRGNLQLTRGNEFQLQNATLDGKLTAEINSQMQPRSVLMEIQLNEVSGHFQKIDLARHSIALSMNLTGNGNNFTLQQLRFSESKADQVEAAIMLRGNGTLNPLTADLNIAIDPVTAPALNLLGSLAGGLDFGKTSLSYQGRVKFQAAQQIESDGNLNVTNASITSPTLKLTVPPMDFSLVHAASFDLKTQLVKLNTMQAGLHEEGREMLALNLSRQLIITLNPSGAAANAEPANINLTIKRFNLLLANAFLPPKSNLRLTAGELSAEINLDAANLGKQVRAAGRVTVENFGFDSGANHVRDLNIKDDFDISLTDFAKLKIKRQELELLRKNQTAMKMTLDGDFDLKKLAGELSVELPALNEQLLTFIPLPEKTAGKIQKMNLNGKIQAKIANQGKSASFNGKLNLDNLTVRNSAELPPKVLQGNLEFDMDQLNGNDFKIRKLDLLAKNNNQTVAQFNTKGNLTLPPAKSESVIEINSEILDTQALMSIFSSATPASDRNPSGKNPSAKTDKPGPIFPAEEPPAADFKGLWLTIHLNLARIRHGKIVISPLKSSIRIRDNKIEVKPLDLVLNQTPIHFRINADLNKPGYIYEVHGDMGAMNLDPILSSTVPEQYRNCISGSVKGFNFDAKGAGVTALNLSRYSDIHFKLDIGMLSLKNLPYQEMAATILLLPDINQIIIDNGSVCLNSSGNGLSIAGTQLSGPDYNFVGSGNIGFDETLNLKFTPGIGGRLEKKVSKLPTGVIFTERNGSYLMAPSLNYPVTGTFRQPQTPGWEELLINSINDIVTEQGKKAILDASKQLMEEGKIDPKVLLRGLGLKQSPAVIPANTPEKSTSPSQPVADKNKPQTQPPAPQPAPKQKKQQDELIESGVDLLKGFLDKK